MSTDHLNPFSYVILVLVGRGGAGPHDLRRNSEQGRIFWAAAPSQWYSEPKRLAKLGYLSARKEPGRTRERTHYELTEPGRAALAEWVRTPASIPRLQHENVVRLLAADLVEPDAVDEGLAGLAEDLAAVREELARARSRWPETLPHRQHLLDVNDRYAQRLVGLLEEWLADARATLARTPPPG